VDKLDNPGPVATVDTPVENTPNKEDTCGPKISVLMPALITVDNELRPALAFRELRP
jgi:hypothetical protein